MDSLQTKTEKLLKYGKIKLSEKGVESAATDIRGVLDDIGNIEVQPNLQEKSVTITENGTTEVTADSSYDGLSKVSVEVNVQPTLQEKNIAITENGTTEVIVDNGYDGLAKVNIEANVKDNSLLNVIKGMNSYETTKYPFELTADMFDENSPSICLYKYYRNQNITKVEMPNNIKSIESSAFQGCSSLTSVTIGNSVTSIGKHAFAYCRSLTSITIPDSLTDIGYYAFSYCSSLTSVTIGNGVTSIRDSIFHYCLSLKIVDFRSATQVPTVQSNSFQNVPTSCKFIIPDELYDSWIVATNWASLYASGYQFIKASEYPTEGLAYTLNSDGTSYSCSGIGTATDTNITVAKTYNNLPVTGVANNAFSGNTNITSVIIPDGIESVGFNAFKDCTNLSSIKVFDSVTNIGVSAFDGTAWYDSQSDGVVYVGKVAYNYKGIMSEDSTSITIQDGTLGIAAQCISSNLSSKLGVSEINIPSSVVFIGEYAFSSCSNLTSITIPENVTKIGSGAFYGCTGLTTINWNAINCEEYGIGPIVFGNCNNVTTLNIGNNVQVLPAVFSDLTNITTLTIPSSVTSINGSFGGCTGLTKVTFEEGSQLTHIGSVTFCDCTALNTINFSNVSQVPILDRINEFETIPSTCQIVVPDALYDEWIAATNWVTHASQIVKASEYTEVQA